MYLAGLLLVSTEEVTVAVVSLVVSDGIDGGDTILNGDLRNELVADLGYDLTALDDIVNLGRIVPSLAPLKET